MKLNFKKAMLSIIITISICFLMITLYLAKGFLTIKKDPEFQRYTLQINSMLNTIHKYKNENKELLLEIESKENDLDMVINPIQDEKEKFVVEQKKVIKNDKNGVKNLSEDIKSLEDTIKQNIKSKNYTEALKHMNALISLQTNKNNLLNKLNLDVTLALKVLQ